MGSWQGGRKERAVSQVRQGCVWEDNLDDEQAAGL